MAKTVVRDSFDLVTVGVMALGALVFVEPAPFDLAIVLLLPVALLSRRLAIPAGSGLALGCIGLFLVANAISLIPARDLGGALRFTAITVYLIGAWVFVAGQAGKLGERATHLIFLGWTIGAVLSTAPAVASYFGAFPFKDRLAPTGRIQALFKDANVLGAYLVPPALWSVSRMVTLERARRLPWAIALVVCGTGILLTYSRGAWISLAVGLVVFFGLRMVGRGSPRARVMTMLLVPVAALVLAVALDRLADIGVVQQMLERRLGPQAYDTHRFATQREAIAIASETPFGIGPGQSEQTFNRAAHNTYVRAFVENGYLGGLALTGLLVASLLRSTWLALTSLDPRLQVAMAVVAGSMAAVCVESVVIDTVHWRHLWVLAALAWTPDMRGSPRAPPPTRA